MSDLKDVDLEGKHLVLRPGVLAPLYRADKTWYVFYAEGGFGCTPGLIGNAVFGKFVRDGDPARFNRSQFARLATPEEIAAAEEAGRADADVKERAT